MYVEQERGIPDLSDFFNIRAIPLEKETAVMANENPHIYNTVTIVKLIKIRNQSYKNHIFNIHSEYNKKLQRVLRHLSRL